MTREVFNFWGGSFLMLVGDGGESAELPRLVSVCERERECVCRCETGKTGEKEERGLGCPNQPQVRYEWIAVVLPYDGHVNTSHSFQSYQFKFNQFNQSNQSIITTLSPTKQTSPFHSLLKRHSEQTTTYICPSSKVTTPYHHLKVPYLTLL